MAKILANCDRAMAALGKKSGAGHVAAVTTAKGRRTATAIGAIGWIYSTSTTYMHVIYTMFVFTWYMHSGYSRAGENGGGCGRAGLARDEGQRVCTTALRTLLCITYLYTDLYDVLTQVERVGGGAPGCGGAGAPVQRVERALAGRHCAGKP